MASYSATLLINQALTNIGILDQGGNPSVSDQNDGLVKLNFMIQQWRIQDKFIWSVGQASYALTANVGSYQIGPAASAPFNVARPDYIEQALIGIRGPNPAKQITWPLKMISQQDYGSIGDLNATANIPERLYNDRASPASTLYLWPIPTVLASTNLILYTWAQLSDFADLVTTYDLPDGYPEAIVNALAIRLAPAFGTAVNAQVLSTCEQLALQAEQKISDLNARARGLMLAPSPQVGQATQTTGATN